MLVKMACTCMHVPSLANLLHAVHAIIMQQTLVEQLEDNGNFRLWRTGGDHTLYSAMEDDEYEASYF